MDPSSTVARIKADGYLPTLDGWRAIAILLVVVSHYAPFFPFLPYSLLDRGGSGVSIFFGISGLLICTLLLREQDQTGRIDLRSFYIRRSFRILPVAWIFLAVVAVLRPVANLPASNSDIWSAAIFLRNYTSSFDGTTWHYWSLAIEEHFYIILPVFLAMFGSKRTRQLCIAVAVLLSVWRCLNAIHPLVTRGSDLFRTDTRIDALFDGALLAILLQQARVVKTLVKIGPWVLYGAGIAGLIGARVIPFFPISRSVVSVSVPLLLIPGLLFPTMFLARLLETRALRWVGRISYSIYIWQGLFTSNKMHLLWGPRYLGLNMVCMFATAVASYYLLERPLIRIGHRLARPRTMARPDLLPQETLVRHP